MALVGCFRRLVVGDLAPFHLPLRSGWTPDAVFPLFIMDPNEILRAMAVKRERGGDRLMLSTGSTLLNLAMTGTPDGGWVMGHYFLFVGDSDSGKTWFMHTALAEASIDERFDDYRLIYDNTEAKSLMDIGQYFGSKLVERIEPPRIVEGQPAFSESVEEFYFNVHDALEADRPFIYILDSQDSITSQRESSKFDKLKAKSRGKKVEVSEGDMSDGKAKVHSSHLRKLIGPLSRTNSLLIVVNQSRDSFSLFDKESYSGGRALKFYAVAQLWSHMAGRLTREYRGKKRQLGVRAKIAVRKNHITGRQSEVEVPIYHSAGIDDVGCCVDWLIDEKVWKKNRSGVIRATDIGPVMEMQREKLIRAIEERNLEEDLYDLVAETWRDIERATAVRRKNKYEEE